jgi:ribosomal protein S18 acetylase RimI-like enzyme
VTPRDAFVYRAAQPSDAVGIAELHARSWRESYRGSFRDEFLDGDLLAERLGVWRERLDRPPDNQLVDVATAGRELVGFVCAYGDHDPRWGSLIDNLHVARAAKRHGVGAALMRGAGRWLAARYPERPVHLLVLEVNAPARRFYEALGGESAEVATMETHGGAVVRSCRYVWPRPSALAGRPDGPSTI